MKNILKVRNIVLGEGTPKICVPIVGTTQEEIYEEAQAVMALPADMVEWRADWFQDVSDLNKITETIKKLRLIVNERPIIFTFRTKLEGGKGQYSKEEYYKLIMAVAEQKEVDFIDIELFSGDLVIAELINRIHSEGIYVIASSHDFVKTPSKSEIIKRLRKMQDLGADVLKIAAMPTCRRDVLTLMEATLEMYENYARRPLVTMSMGADGVISRLAGEIFGSSISFSAVKKASAPGQIGIREVCTATDIIHKGCCPNHIFLIGFMGSGKTSVSSWLGKNMNIKEADTDKLIEQKENRTINNIFERFGEEYFREAETTLLQSLKNETKKIISCGGGMAVKKENVRLMHQQGTVILLNAKPKTIYQRVKNNKTRPLLNDDMSIDHIEELMQKRECVYKEAADIIIDTNGKSIARIGEEIIQKLEELSK